VHDKPLKAYANVGLMRLARRIGLTKNPARPVVLYAEPTLFCNLGCPSCPTGLKLDVRPRVTMDMEWFKRVIDELGPYLFYLNTYNWGEPLLHKQFPEMVAYAKRWNIRVLTSSNLSVPVEREYIERLVRSGLDKLKVGMEGTSQEEYAKYRVRGTFDLVTRNMQTIQEIKRELGFKTPTITIGFHVFEHNQGSIDEARRLHREWGADRITFSASFVSEQAENQGIHASTLPQFNLYRPEGLKRSSGPCSWLWGATIANPGGSISPCCAVVDRRSDFEPDARSKSMLGDVWNNAVYRRARAAALQPRSNRGQPVHLIRDGMQLSSVAAADEHALICDRCPNPHRQDYVDRILDSVVSGARRDITRGKNLRIRARALAQYVLMGMPPVDKKVKPRRGERNAPAASPAESLD